MTTIMDEYLAGKQLTSYEAMAVVAIATRDGKLVRSNACELCDTPKKMSVFYRLGKVNERSNIVAHHWNGYDHPLDVWWICYRCNRVLFGKYFHSGQVSKEEARQIIRAKQNKPTSAKS